MSHQPPSQEEIQEAHDLLNLYSMLIDADLETEEGRGMSFALRQASSAMCWVLGHTDGGSEMFEALIEATRKDIEGASYSVLKKSSHGGRLN